MSRNQKLIFAVIFLTASFLFFYRLGRHDMLLDDGHYAFRALGYFDFLNSEKQTTPVQWFGHRPVWSYLSFHDHPPLFFLLQNLVFKIFGASVVSSRLLSVFAALGTVSLTFFLGRRLGGTSRVGLLAAGALVLNTHFIWTGRIGLLESLLIFFLTTGLFFLVKGWQDQERNFLWAGLFFGFAFLTKFTVLATLPGIFVFLIWQKRVVLKSKMAWLGAAIFLAVISPVVVYNIATFQTRGHFDVQFSQVFNQPPTDWPLLSNRLTGQDWDFMSFISTGPHYVSWPYFLVFLLSLPFAIWFGRRNGKKEIFLTLFALGSLEAFFLYVAPNFIWMGIVSPFVALTIAFGLEKIFSLPVMQKKLANVVTAAGLLLTGLGSLFFSINTNHLTNPIGNKNFYAEYRLENLGYNQLDQKMRVLLSRASSPVSALPPYIGSGGVNLRRFDGKSQREFKGVIVFDSQANWFPTIWTFQRFRIYNRMFIVSIEEFFEILEREDVLERLPVDGIYFVSPNDNLKHPVTELQAYSTRLRQDFEKLEVTPEVIHDDKQNEAFYIYYANWPSIKKLWKSGPL
ncbi:MAG: hypothetical protein UY65_C0001G0051 [Parcubacteria group bacterium GW2011_GWA2_51_12]|nr:MAG: hypothetical protein UY65_C0001G0051 [Parcubacteria group bacterium GW2011_GWA2_51_12]